MVAILCNPYEDFKIYKVKQHPTRETKSLVQKQLLKSKKQDLHRKTKYIFSTLWNTD